MSNNFASLEKTCKQMLDSLLAGSRHTLCLNIAEPGFVAEKVALEHLRAQGRNDVELHDEPGPSQFAEILGGLSGKTAIVAFADLDKQPKCIDQLLDHVKSDPKGKLVVVSRAWNSDNTKKELELRKHCLFYQQNLAAPPKRAGA